MKRKFILSEIDFGDGWILLDCFHLCPSMPLEDQIDFLNEDLLSIAYDYGQYIIDIGWYPSNEIKKGAFKIVLVNNSDWDTPILKRKCKTLAELDVALLYFAEYVKTNTKDYSKYPEIPVEYKLDKRLKFVSHYSSQNRCS